MKIAILTDSSAGIFQKELKGTDIHTIPLHIITEKAEDIFDVLEETKNIKLDEMIKNQILKTSQASPGEIKNKLDELLKTYDYVIYYPVASELSSQYRTAFMVAQEDEYKGKVSVFKSIVCSYALKRLVFLIDDAIKDGKNVEELLELSNNYQKSVYTFLIPEDLSRLNKSGRVPKTIISLINVLKVRIIIEWSDNPKKIGLGKNCQKLVRKICAIFSKLNSDEYDFYFSPHDLCDKKVLDHTKRTLEDNDIPYKIKMLANIFPVHSGINTLGFLFIPKKWEISKNDLI